jgi:hypothetical protein
MIVFGTPEYYAEMFADIIADIEYETPQRTDNLIAGFKLAIADWRKYHVDQTKELDRAQLLLDD